jgi:hexokinase
MKYALNELVRAPICSSSITMKLAENGSTLGAALAAAMNYNGSPPISSQR